MIECYHPPVNIAHMSDKIYMSEDKVFEYTKELYEKGLGRKTIPIQSEDDIQRYFRWEVKYISTNYVFRKIIDFLMFF